MQVVRSFVAVGLVALLGAQRPAPRELDARQILERMAKVYAECRTYRDSGVVKTVFIQDGKNRTATKPFTTAFVQPDRFRYEFEVRDREEEFDRYLIWSDGEVVRRWWDVRPGVEEDRPLESALSGAKGVSGNSSYTIPVLLLDLISGFRRVTELPNTERKADKDLDGTLCFLVDGGAPDDPMTLWIDQKTFLLRRIDAQRTFDDFRTEETTTYVPVLDGEIPEFLLVFDPPQEEAGEIPPFRRPYLPGPEELDAARILERTTQVYAGCKTYRDTGMVTKVGTRKGRKRTEKVPFTTAFVRPDRFRYECQNRRGEEFDRCLVWRKDQEVRSWWEVRPGIEQRQPPLSLPGANLTTFGSATTIPELLLPEEMSGVRVTYLPNVERMQDEEIEGSPCFVLHDRPRAITLWIDQRSFLLRRIDSVYGASDTVTTTFEPVIDAEIPESLLVFDPPVPRGALIRPEPVT